MILNINPLKSVKTFVIERQQTQQSTIVDFQIDLRQSYINLNYIFSVYCHLQQHKVSIYDPSLNKFVSFQKIGAQNGFISQRLLEPKIILIRFKKGKQKKNQVLIQSDSLDSSIDNESQNKKQQRSKQRTIAQVIQLVKKWRQLHLHGHKYCNRRMNLQEAAKIVGISKKSLDDYYCQLRLGQFYNFEFSNHLQDKIGVLRNFVKNYRPQKEGIKLHNQKHPKNLRVIQQYQIQSQTLVPYEQQIMIQSRVQQINLKQKPTESQKMQQQSRNIQINLPLQIETIRKTNSIYSMQLDYFRGFQAAIQDPIDPYLDIERDFTKKDYQNDSMNFFYF